MADPNDTRGAPPREVHIEKKKINWPAWIALIAGILALLWWLSRGNHEQAVVTPTPVAAQTQVVGATPNAATSAALGSMAGLGTYLAGTDAAPRAFTFEKLNFETGASAIRPADAAEIGSIAATLKQYAATQIRIAGYADARGSDAANTALGKSRADSVKAALVAQGIDGARIETVSGGDADPVATNATASGQAENRRTELVVTAR